MTVEDTVLYKNLSQLYSAIAGQSSSYVDCLVNKHGLTRAEAEEKAKQIDQMAHNMAEKVYKFYNSNKGDVQ